MKTFKNYLTEESSDINLDLSEEDIVSIVNSLDWDDIYDLYEGEELVEEEDEENEDDEDDKLKEALTLQARLKRGQRARRAKTKLTQARRLKLRRPSNMNVLRNRAKIAARRMLMKRFLKNRNKKYISAQEKSRIETQISSMSSIVNNLSTRLVPKMRDIERKRLVNTRNKLAYRKK